MIHSLDRANLTFIPGFCDEAGNARLILYFIAKKDVKTNDGSVEKPTSTPSRLALLANALLEIVFNQTKVPLANR